MFPSRNAFDGDSCPVDEELLGRMYRASESGLPKLVETVSSDVRVMLALFCYKRAHMHSLALAIASSCSERDLSRVHRADHLVDPAAQRDQADGRQPR